MGGSSSVSLPAFVTCTPTITPLPGDFAGAANSLGGDKDPKRDEQARIGGVTADVSLDGLDLTEPGLQIKRADLFEPDAGETDERYAVCGRDDTFEVRVRAARAFARRAIVSSDARPWHECANHELTRRERDREAELAVGIHTGRDRTRV